MQINKIILILGSALFLSLVANVFMAGMLVGKSYSGGARGPDRHAEWQQRDQLLREKLPKEDYKLIKETMQGKREQFRALKQDLDAARRKVEEAADAEPFNQAALDAAMAAEREKKTALLQAMRETRKDLSQRLSPEGRRIFEKAGSARGFGGRDDGSRRWQQRQEGFPGAWNVGSPPRPALREPPPRDPPPQEPPPQP